MKPIFADSALDRQLLEEGYVIIPFLREEEIGRLTDFYYAHHERTLDGMYATAHLSDIDLRMKMNNYIREQFGRAIAETFVNANALGGSYIVKGKGAKGTLHPHQDWNIVDEALFRSFNIWVPLVDLDESNGTIAIIPRSHSWAQTYRSANLSPDLGYSSEELWHQMVRLQMKAGEALVYDHRLIHASGENTTDQLRLATVFGLIPDEAEMLYYHKKDDHTIEVYESNPEFFLYGNIFEGPKNLVKRTEFKHGADPVPALLSQATGPGKSKSFFQKIKEYLSA